MNTKSKITVDLRIYKGKEILLKADGKTVQNENQSLKLTYGDTQWAKHLANLPKLGICKVEVSGVYEGENKIDASQEILDEVAAILKPKEVELTPDQKRIADLEAKIEALTSTKKAASIEVKEPKAVTG